MREAGSCIFYTMKSGQLTLERKGGILFAEAYLEPQGRYGVYLRGEQPLSEEKEDSGTEKP